MDHGCCGHFVVLPKLTWILLALLEGLVDINEGEVVSLWVLKLHVALCSL